MTAEPARGSPSSTTARATSSASSRHSAAVGAAVPIARDAEALGDADAVVVPGVGAAAPAMERLDRPA